LDGVVEEVRAAETAVALAALGVEDPQLGPPPRRSVAAAGDKGVGSLTDDVPMEANPAEPTELQPEPARLGDRGREAAREAGRLEGDEERLGPSGERRQTSPPVGDLRSRRASVRSGRQVDHEDVDRSCGEEHAGDRQTLVERLRRQDDEPIEADAARNGLDGVERVGKVQPGHDRSIELGLGDEAQRERRRARRRRSSQCDAGTPWEPTRPHDRVELRKAGPDDPLDASSRLARGRRSELGWVVGRLGRKRRRGQRPDHPRSCGTPPRLEGRQSRRHVRGEAGHRTLSIEHTFYSVKMVPTQPAAPKRTASRQRRVTRHPVVTQRRYGRRS
jgi:hypothetical protein